MERSFGQIEQLVRAALNGASGSTASGYSSVSPSSTTYYYVVELYPSYVIYCQSSLDCSPGDGPDKSWKRSYAIDDSGNVTLGDPVQVAMQTIYLPVATMSREYLLPADQLATFAGEEGESYVIREGVIFEAGDYPDKAYSMTPEELEQAVQNFQPVPVDLEHVPTVLSGKLGMLQEVRLSEDKRKIFGKVALPAWLDKAIGETERKVSSTWNRATKQLAGLALVRNPRVKDAVLMAAFAADTQERVEFIGRRNNAQDQETINRMRDFAKQMQELADKLGAVSAEQARRELGLTVEGAPQEEKDEPDTEEEDEETDAAKGLPAMQGNVSPGDAGAKSAAGKKKKTTPATAERAPDGGAAQDTDSGKRNAAEEDENAQRKKKRAKFFNDPEKSELPPELAAFVSDKNPKNKELRSMPNSTDVTTSNPATGANGAGAGNAPETVTFSAAEFAAMQAKIKELESRTTEQAVEIERQKVERRRAEAALFADNLISRNLILPREKKALVVFYEQAAQDDEDGYDVDVLENNLVAFSAPAGADGKAGTTPESLSRVEALKILFESRQPHVLTQELAAADEELNTGEGRVLFMNGGKGGKGGAGGGGDNEQMDAKKKARLMSYTQAGAAKAKNGGKPPAAGAAS